MNQTNPRSRTFGSRIAILAALSAALGVCVSAHGNTPKRGWGGDREQMIEGINASWYYTWWTGANAGVTTAEFVPIIQNHWAMGDLNRLKNDAAVKSILGFNEPERSTGSVANNDFIPAMPVAEALDRWATIAATGKRVISPAVSDDGNGQAWIRDFVAGVDSRGLRLDGIAFHWYGDTRGGVASAAGFLNRVDDYYNRYAKGKGPGGTDRTIWITEFGGIDWSGNNPISLDTNRAFLEAAAAGLESRAYVEKYCWFQWNPSCRMMNDDLSLTTLGDYYTGNTIVPAGQTMDLASKGGNTGNDTWYVRSGTVTNTGALAGGYMRRVLVTGNSTMTGTNNFALKDEYLRIDPGATLTKTGANTLDLQNLKLDNNGTLAISGGVVRLRGGIASAGAGGVIRVNAGGTLALSSTDFSTGNALNMPIQLQGGTIRADDYKQTISSTLTVDIDSTLGGAGELVISAPLSGSGRISKSGTGMLRVSSTVGAPSRTGPTSIAAGTLMVQGFSTTQSNLGTGNVSISVGGRLAGIGIIGGATNVLGEISPGLSDSSPGLMKFANKLTLTNYAVVTLDVGATTMDRLSVTGTTVTTTLDGTLRFRLPEAYDPAFATRTAILATMNGFSGQFDRTENIAISDTKALAITYETGGVFATVARLGDSDLDGAVTFNDLLSLARNYNVAAGATWSSGDLTGEGAVTFEDLLALARNYGQSDVAPAALAATFGETFADDWALAQSVVPEPTSLGLVALTLLPLRRRRPARESRD